MDDRTIMSLQGILRCALLIGVIVTIGAAEEVVDNYRPNPTQVIVYRNYPAGTTPARKNLICGGTIISARLVLTTHNCLMDLDNFGRNLGELEIGYGCADAWSCNHRIRVTDLWMRRNYTVPSDQSTNPEIIDVIAVLRLENDIPLSSARLRIVDLERTTVRIDGTQISYSGWGIEPDARESWKKTTTHFLSRVLVEPVNTTKCQTLGTMAPSDKLPNKFCADPLARNWKCANALGGGLVDGNVLRGLHVKCINSNGPLIFLHTDSFYDVIKRILHRFYLRIEPGKHEDSYFRY